jgi:hypothetical protein
VGKRCLVGQELISQTAAGVGLDVDRAYLFTMTTEPLLSGIGIATSGLL